MKTYTIIIDSTDTSIMYLSTPSRVIALNNRSGEPIWYFKCSQLMHSKLVLKKNTLYFEGMNKMFYAIDKVSGKQIWTFRTKGVITVPLVTESDIIIADKINLYSLDLNSGVKKWDLEIKRSYTSKFILTTLITKNKYLYYLGSDNSLYKINVFSGNIDKTFNMEKYNIINTVGIKNEIISFFVMKNSNPFSEQLYLELNINNGDIRKVVLGKNRISSYPILIDKYLLTPTVQGGLKVIDIDSGELVWERSNKDINVNSDYVVYQNNIYFISIDDYITTINLIDGNVSCHKPLSDIDECKLPNELVLFNLNKMYFFE